MNVHIFAVIYVVLSVLISDIKGYKIVFMIHGVMGDKGSLDFLSEYIKQAHPGTEVHNMNLYPSFYSLERMWKQVRGFRAEMERIVNNRTEDIHILDGFLHVLFPHMVRDEAYRFFYTRVGQYTSVSNYWNDPRKQNDYVKYSSFLAPINNEALTEDSKRYRRNMMRLKQVVLIGGPDDGVITPWQSSQFGFYDANMTVMPLRWREGYSMDSIGLKTLDKRGRLHMHTYPGIHHLLWNKNLTVIRRAILPYLD